MQSNTTKALVAIGSIALIVVLFVVLSGEDEETSPATSGGTDVTSAETGHEENEAGHEDSEHGKPATKPGAGGDGGEGADVPAIVVSGGEPEGGVAELEFQKGDEIRFTVESDVAEEVHVHGYDIYGDLEPGKPASFAFPAEIDGVYEVELHGTGAVIAELRVKP